MTAAEPGKVNYKYWWLRRLSLLLAGEQSPVQEGMPSHTKNSSVPAALHLCTGQASLWHSSQQYQAALHRPHKVPTRPRTEPIADGPSSRPHNSLLHTPGTGYSDASSNRLLRRWFCRVSPRCWAVCISNARRGTIAAWLMRGVRPPCRRQEQMVTTWIAQLQALHPCWQAPAPTCSLPPAPLPLLLLPTWIGVKPMLLSSKMPAVLADVGSELLSPA
jgi:hypothetical protein